MQKSWDNVFLWKFFKRTTENSLVQRLILDFVLHIIMNYAKCILQKKSALYASNQSKPELDESKYAHCVAYVNQLLHHGVNTIHWIVLSLDLPLYIHRWFLTNMLTLCSCYLRGFNFVFVVQSYTSTHLVSCQSKEIPKYPNASI